jgi:hypothetical protein
MWDLRKPSGVFFALLGAILIAAGLIGPDARAPLTDVNVNLYSGLSMLTFGGALLWLARRPS